jgi:hypothetical protein
VAAELVVHPQAVWLYEPVNGRDPAGVR